MSRMRSLIPVVVLMTVVAGPARAAVLSAGANFGVSYVTEGDGLLGIHVPGSSDPYFGGLMPGLRLGINDQTFRHLVAIDLGLTYLNSSGSSLHVIELMGSYQHHLVTQGRTAPFINLGAGLVNVGGDSASETRVLVGAGVGVRQTLVHGHGAGRFEMRLDHLNEKDFDPSLNVISFRVGFDLYGQ